MSSALYKVRCPNPAHEDSNPSCAVYEDGLHCFSRCGRITFDQLEDWVGEREAKRIRTQPSDSGTGANIRQSDRAARPTWDERTGPAFIRLCHANLVRGPRRCRIGWFTERGFNIRALQRWQLGHTGTHFVIPLYGVAGIAGYKLRRDERYCDPDSPKFLVPTGLRNFPIRPNPTGSPTIVVEGELDAILASELGIDAITVSTGSGSLPTLADTLLGLRVPILLLPDSDTTGHDTMQALRQALDAHKVDTTWIEFPYGGDMCGFVRDTPAEDRFDAVRKLLSD